MTSRLAFSSTPATPATPSTTTRRYAVPPAIAVCKKSAVTWATAL